MHPDRSSAAASGATTLELSWPSQLAVIDDAATTIDTLIMRLGGDRAMRDAVELALREALANAIIHAHHEDADQRVELTVALTPGGFALTVRDRGPGFDLASVPDPTHPDATHAPGGRGLFLIRHAMDHAHWQPRPDGGTELHMHKRWP